MWRWLSSAANGRGEVKIALLALAAAASRRPSQATGGAKHRAVPLTMGERRLSDDEDVVTLVSAAIGLAASEALERDPLAHTDQHCRLLGELLTDLGVHSEKRESARLHCSRSR